jgi:predicted ATP-dependent endonuclease of OLD family
MENIKIRSLGPIVDADVNFGDLTLLVGPQASGKSIFIQMLKLIVDKKQIRKTLEQYNFIWSKDSDVLFDLFFGDGMHGIWKDNTEIIFDNRTIDKKNWLPKQNESYKNASETMFYIPAQRILSIADGRPKYFTEFDESVPYVLRHFSETLRQLMQSDIGKQGSVFPLSQRLKAPLRNSFNDSIFHNGKVVIENISGQRKFRMQIDGLSIPFMTWSAGQKEFMPLLLSFYWLCTSSKISRRDDIKIVVIEEPEMGLHPQAIKSVILQVIDLLSRDYKVIVSTHSPVFLEFAWAFNLLKQSKVSSDSLFELFDIKKTTPTKRLFENIVEKKSINTYYFDRENDKVSVKDISSLDAGSENESISNWGGLSEFSGRATDIVSKYHSED